MFFVSFLFFLIGFQDVFSRNLFVSHRGQDAVSCGNSSSPCRSIRFAVNVSSSEDIILIEHAQGKPYKECEHFRDWKCSIQLTKSLSFIGINGKAAIHCRRFCNLFKISTQGRTLSSSRIKFVNVIISRTDIAVLSLKANVEVVLERCILKNNDVGVYMKGSTHCSIRTFNTSFEESTSWAMRTNCVNLTAHFVSTLFKASPVSLQTFIDSHGHWQITEVFISSCVFDGKGKPLGLCAQLLKINLLAVIVNVTIDSSNFTNHRGNCPGGQTNALYILDNSYCKRKLTLITLNKLYVENNYSPLAAMKLVPFYKIKTSFKVELLNTVFRNNTRNLIAGMKSSSRSRFRGPTILLTNTTFLKNNYVSGLTNRPTVHFLKGRIQLTSCHFLDNICGDLPTSAVVMISDFAVVKFKDCYYETSQVRGKSLQVYAAPRSRLIFTGNNTFNIVTLKSNRQIFTHMPPEIEGNFGTIRLQGILKILCPQGYVLKSQSKCKIYKNKILWVYFQSTCEQCPPKTYSLERGKLYNNITNKLKCQDCPRGGLCEGGQVTAKPNFWGYRRKERVSFLACPPDYCCDSEDCNSYDGCYGNRTGALCGQCPDGMSEPLFDTKCKSNRQCTSVIFWPGVLCFLILYLIFFLYHEEITRFIRKGLSLKSPFISRIRDSNMQNSSGQISSLYNQNCDPKGSGFLKIIFYYYQIVHLFRRCVGSRRSNKILSNLQKIFSRTLNLIVVNIPSFDCPFQDLQPVWKAFVLHSIGYCLLALVGVLFLFAKFFMIIKVFGRRVKDHNQCTTLETFGTVNQTQRSTSHLSVRIVSAFTYISLLTYSSSAQLCLSLLHCVPLGDKQVLFIDGTIKCYQPFQYVLLVYVVFSIIPFCLIPVLGSYLLKEGAISVPQFCVACVFPLPFVCYWVYLFLKNCSCGQGSSNPSTEQEPEVTTTVNGSDSSLSREAILRVLLEPFRYHKSFLCFPASFLPWEGFLIFRRLVLIIVLTFIYDNRLRMIVALIICVAVLLSHMYVHPFINSHENFLESLSLSTLIVLCGLTLVQALYQGEDFSSSSNSLSLLKAFDMLEDVLIIIPIAIIICIVIFSLLIRFMAVFRYCIQTGFARLKRFCKGR